MDNQIMDLEELERGFLGGTLFSRSAYRLETLDWYSTTSRLMPDPGPSARTRPAACSTASAGD